MYIMELDYFVANLFKARKVIEKLAIAIKEYTENKPNFRYQFEYPYPKDEMNSIIFNRELFTKYLKFAKEIPDEVVADNLILFKQNPEYTLQNILIILIKYYKELAYLYKASDVATEMSKNNTQIEYVFTNPFEKYTTLKLKTQSKKYTANELITLSNSDDKKLIDIFNIDDVLYHSSTKQIKQMNNKTVNIKEV